MVVAWLSVRRWAGRIWFGSFPPTAISGQLCLPTGP
jgi:hypothetical protein